MGDDRASQTDLTNLSQRGKLVATLLVLDAIQTKTLTADACAQWMRDTLGVAAETVGEHGVGIVPLKGSVTPQRTERFQAIADASRQLVVKTLRGLLSTPQSDGFIAKALYKSKVRRPERGESAKWVPVPASSDTFGELMLLVFLVDILSYRDSYDSRLSICDSCDRITFVERRGVRFGCPQHPV